MIPAAPHSSLSCFTRLLPRGTRFVPLHHFVPLFPSSAASCLSLQYAPCCTTSSPILLKSVALSKLPAAARRCGTGVWWAGRSWAAAAHLLADISGAGQVQHRGGHSPAWPGAPPAAAAATSPAGRRRRRGGAARVCGGPAQLGRCRTLACWHQWGWASAAQGWTQPGLACCTTGSGGSDEPRQAGSGGEAVRHGCVAGRAQLGRCRTLACWHQWGWASAAQGWAQPGLAWRTTGSGGSDEPRQAGGGGEAVRHGCVAGRAQLGRCRTLACWHQWGWASAAQGWAQPGPGLAHHRQRRQRRAPAGRRRRRGGAARVCGGPGAAGQVPHTLLAGISGAGQVQHRGGHQPGPGLLYPPAAAAATSPGRRRRRRGGAARVCGVPGALYYCTVLHLFVF